MTEPTPDSPAARADRRRRLEADIEDAKKAFHSARARFDGLCDELTALAREERALAKQNPWKV